MMEILLYVGAFAVGFALGYRIAVMRALTGIW